MAKNADGTNGKGHPRSFPTGEIFIDCVDEYIEYCNTNKRFPNIAGFCVFNKGKKKNFRINEDTYYTQKQYYSEEYAIADAILQDGILQDNSYRMQLYLKNKFGYRDKQDIDLSVKEMPEIVIKRAE